MNNQTVACAVALTSCSSYAAAAATEAVGRTLDASGWHPPRGPVLVKPNLLRAVPLACTHPQVTAAVCRWLLDKGARVTVADSPGFGSARGVSRAIGLDAALAPLGVRVCALDDPVPVPLRGGGSWGVTRTALEADAIVSVPRVKAHAQVRLTLAVKNLFGCICGLGKVMAHSRRGGCVAGPAAGGRGGGRRDRHAHHRPVRRSALRAGLHRGFGFGRRAGRGPVYPAGRAAGGRPRVGGTAAGGRTAGVGDAGLSAAPA